MAPCVWKMFCLLSPLYIRKWMVDAVLIFRNHDACLEESDSVCGCYETYLISSYVLRIRFSLLSA
uniref:Secreted protein n=1 Tax=Hordeum vulgare subsp. vulgare TaxID=112509 RepID=A0A8I6Y755_HORVV